MEHRAKRPDPPQLTQATIKSSLFAKSSAIAPR
jgi:hypothetical protein